MREKVAVVGMGNVGTAIGIALYKAGYKITGFSSRRRRVSTLLKICSNFSTNPEEITSSADIVFLTVPDDLIEVVCQRIVSLDGFKDGSLIIHTSGALSSDILKSAKGCRRLSIHPIKVFSSITPHSYKDTYFSIEGDDVQTGMRIVEDIGGRAFLIKGEDKLLYHTALTFSASLLTGLLALERSILKRLGLNENLALFLAKDTIKNIECYGLEKSFSGPAKRLDKETIRKEIDALKSISSTATDAYKVLTKLTISIERDLGVISRESADSLLSQIEV
ncbi:DUF2520 domain-containing protein [candidate division WOR-3 bacterium]|nr:DUF2520 domain-containing protein [candidate division WOR-3 bacterium]